MKSASIRDPVNNACCLGHHEILPGYGALAVLFPGLFLSLNLHFLPRAKRYPAASCGKQQFDDIVGPVGSVDQTGRRCPALGQQVLWTRDDLLL